MKLFIIGQLLTVFGYLLYYASRYCRTKTKMVESEAFSKCVIAVSFLFLNNFAGAFSNLITMLRSILIYIKEKKKKPMMGAYVVVLIACVLCGLMTYVNIFNTFSYVAAIITTTAGWFGNEQQIRKWGIIASVFYMIFQISCMNVMGILFEGGTIMMTFFSYRRYMEIS